MKYIIMLLLSTIIIAGCGNSGGSDSPANSVKDFVKAVKEGNTPKAWNYLTADSQKQFETAAKQRNLSGKEMFEKDFQNPKSLGNLFEDFEVVDEQKEGESAKVVLKFVSGKTLDVFSLKDGSAWKYDMVKTNKELMKLVE